MWTNTHNLKAVDHTTVDCFLIIDQTAHFR
jgi:hypothetical protein